MMRRSTRTRAHKKHGGGRHSKEQALRDLIVDLAQIWEDVTRRPFHASRKDHRKTNLGQNLAAPRRHMATRGSQVLAKVSLAMIFAARVEGPPRHVLPDLS